MRSIDTTFFMLPICNGETEAALLLMYLAEGVKIANICDSFLC